MRAAVLIVLAILCLPNPLLSAELLPGRYEAMVIGQGSHVFVIDTKEGHCWGYDLQGNALRYYGQFRPGTKFGEVISENQEKTLEELKQQMAELQRTIEEREAALKEGIERGKAEEIYAESPTELQKAIARAQLKEEVKAEIIAAIDDEDLGEQQKKELKSIIEKLK